MKHEAKLPLTRSRNSFLLAALLLFWFGLAQAQTQNITDGITPPAIAPGAPLGTYPISEMENYNPFTGDLSLRFTAAVLGGRGSVSYPVVLTFGGQRWTVDKSYDISTGLPIYTPTTSSWRPVSFFSAPRMLARRVSNPQILCNPNPPHLPPDPEPRPVSTDTLTRLTFTAPDGTEYEFRDAKTGGQQRTSSCANDGAKFNRERVFKTIDGAAATFIAANDVLDATNVWDDVAGMTGVTWVGGDMYLRDGTQYHFSSDDGYVQWIRDRDGNKITFSYSVVSTFPLIFSMIITDPLNRQVEVRSGVTDAQHGDGTQITFRGFGGAERKIFLTEKPLSQGALRATQSGDTSTVKTYMELFGFNSVFSPPFDPYVTTDIWLPDGRRYQLFYNVYGEVARIIFPTGGATEYDWEGGVDAYPDGVFPNGVDPLIYRRVVARRLYHSDSLSSLVSQTAYSKIPVSGWLNTPLTVTVEQKDAGGNTLSVSKHKYYTNPLWGMVQIDPMPNARWDDGKENETELLSGGGALLRRVTNNWQLSASGVDPHITETMTALLDGSPNLVSRQAFSYDQYNNVTDVYEYEFGASAPGPLIRRTHTDYVTSNNGADYAGDLNIHIRNLPLRQQVFDAGGIKRAETLYEYDNYSPDAFHAALSDRSNISGHDGAFSTGHLTRGNLTKTSRSLLDNNGNPTGSISSYAQYDIAGNIVKAIDAKGNPTTFDFSDRFGSPGDDAEQNTPPAGLNGQSAYAFATKVTNALNQTAYTKYDYYLGQPVNRENANGVVNSVEYNDDLDRPTQAIQARYKFGGGALAEKRQTTITYDDANHVITTTGDRDTYNDNKLTSKSYYDGLGRTFRRATYEGSTGWTIKDTQFDALGRVSQVSNPYRAPDSGSASPPAGLWTAMNYDALSRVIKVTTPDTAHVDTAYNGNQVTVTDQAGKKRSSQTDALGRLVQVTEDPGMGKLNYNTTYLYDVLGNLCKVTQGAQTRWFAYDSLSRLIRAKNPEQATNGSLPSYTDPVTGGSGWSMAYSYDANGNLASRTDANDITTTYLYDALNRNTDVIYNDSTPHITRTYDTAIMGKGQLGKTETAGSMGTRVTINDYDAMGRPKSQSQQFFYSGAWGTSYLTLQTYDLASNVTTLTYPSNHTVTYTYDQAGRLSSFTGKLGDGQQRTYSTITQYHPAGMTEQEIFGTDTPLYHKQRYNNRLQLGDMRLSTASDALSHDRGALLFYYGQNAGDPFANDPTNNGNLVKQENYIPSAGGGDAVATDNYTYDALNRIASVTEPNVFSQAYDHGRYGNRHITGASGPVNNYNPGYDELTNRISGLGYDPAGNITSDLATGGTMIYDAENHMLTAMNGVTGKSGSYTYDADGKRVRRITGAGETWYIYGIGGELLAEYAANGAPTAPQKEYGYRGGQLLIVAESGSGGGVSLVKPNSKSRSDLIAKKGSGARRAANRIFSLDKPYAAFGHNKGYGSITAASSNIDNKATLVRGGPRTTVEEYGNTPSANDAGAKLTAEHPAGATSSAPRKEYGYRSGRPPVAMQSGGVITVNPATFETPYSGQGGYTVTSPINKGHGDTSVSLGAGGFEYRTCRWFNFPTTVSGQIISIKLKFDWAYNNAFLNSVNDSNNFNIFYSLNGDGGIGGPWVNVVDLENVTGSNSGSVEVTLPTNQNLSLVQVRDSIGAGAIFGLGAGISASVSNIRLEVTVAPPIISNVAAGGITISGATITWTTDFNSDSQVEYGPTTAYGQSTTLDPVRVTAHSQVLSGLNSNRLYHYRVKSKDAAGNLTLSGDFTFTTLPRNDAAFVSQSVPATMTVGAAYAITVSMLNQGDTTWTPGQLYRLGSQNPQDNGTWGLGRVNLLAGASVSPGATATFSFVVTAPSSPGSYNFQWQMVQDGVEWFGAKAPNVVVQVVPPDTTPPTVTSFFPASGATNVNINSNPTVTFSEAMNASTVNGSTVELRDPANNLVPATVSYNTASFTATLDPTAALSAGTTYTARVRGGSTDPRVKDTAGNALATDVTWTFTTAQIGAVAIKWLVTDHLGSTRMVVDQSGSLAGIERHDYLPFGEELAGVGIRSENNGYRLDSVRQKFGSKERDIETGLDYFGARYFASVQGRFTSPDPVAGSCWNPQSLNAYAYAWNNPLKLTDPTGMIVSWEDSEKKKKKGETEERTDAQRNYENRIKQLLNSNDPKDRAKGQRLQDTYDRLKNANETFHVVKNNPDGASSGELTYAGQPGHLYVNLKGNSSEYAALGDIQKIAHEFKHGEQFLDGLLGFAKGADGKWHGYRDDLVDEANAFIAGFEAEPLDPAQRGNKFLDAIGTAMPFGLNDVVNALDRQGPYVGRNRTQNPITNITPTIYAVPRSK